MIGGRLTMHSICRLVFAVGQPLLALTALTGTRANAQAPTVTPVTASAGLPAATPAGTAIAPAEVTRDSMVVWAPVDTLAARVALEIATRWRIGVERLRLDWSAVPPGTQVAPRAAFTLAGPSSSGVVTLRFGGSGAAPVTELVVRAGVEAVAPVARRRLARGIILADTDIAFERVVLWGKPVATHGQVAAGWVTRRVVAPGEVLRAPAVAPAPLITAGQSVEFTFRQDGILLTLQGIATHAASLGEPVLVRLGANRRLSGIVTGRAKVVADDIQRKS